MNVIYFFPTEIRQDACTDRLQHPHRNQGLKRKIHCCKYTKIKHWWSLQWDENKPYSRIYLSIIFLVIFITHFMFRNGLEKCDFEPSGVRFTNGLLLGTFSMALSLCMSSFSEAEPMDSSVHKLLKLYQVKLAQWKLMANQTAKMSEDGTSKTSGHVRDIRTPV